MRFLISKHSDILLQLMCNYYTLRQDGSRAYIRSWSLQVKMTYKSFPFFCLFAYYFCPLWCSYLKDEVLTEFASCFQGSLDGKTWTNLSVHENDQTVCKLGQFVSWPIVGPNALRPFRFFRALLTGPTTDISNPCNLCICFLELYGYFH